MASASGDSLGGNIVMSEVGEEGGEYLDTGFGGIGGRSSVTFECGVSASI